MTSYKKVHYEDRNQRNKHNPVTYVRFEDQIIFMGMARNCTSTIDAAEQIINAITQREGVDPGTLTFYDLQTRQGYSHLKPGQFILNQLTLQIEGGIVTNVEEWRSCDGDPDKLRCFQGFISDERLNTPLKNIGVADCPIYPIR